MVDKRRERVGEGRGKERVVDKRGERVGEGRGLNYNTESMDM